MEFKHLNKILLATGNKGKIAEFRKAFADYPIEWHGLSDFPSVDVEETGDTFLENACIKALAGLENSGLPTFADDSGLIVEAMGEYPGVRSARIGGEALTDRQRCEFLLEAMKNAGLQEKRPAYFSSTIVLALSNEEIYWTEGKVCGEIRFSMKGDEGFGYDPIFYLPEFDKTMAELSMERKNAISHRGRAVKAFLAGDYKRLKAGMFDKSS